MDFFQTPLISGLLKTAAFVAAIVIIIKLIKHAAKDFKESGWKGIIEEFLLGLGTIGVLIFILADGINIIMGAVQRLVPFLAKLLLWALDTILGFFGG